jgi:hypothetical protein
MMVEVAPMGILEIANRSLTKSSITKQNRPESTKIFGTSTGGSRTDYSNCYTGSKNSSATAMAFPSPPMANARSISKNPSTLKVSARTIG